MDRRRIHEDIDLERERQDRKWGVQRHNLTYWSAILGEEYGEACKEIVEHEAARRNEDNREQARRAVLLRNELIQLSAVAVEIVEQLDEHAELAAALEEAHLRRTTGAGEWVTFEDRR